MTEDQRRSRGVPEGGTSGLASVHDLFSGRQAGTAKRGAGKSATKNDASGSEVVSLDGTKLNQHDLRDMIAQKEAEWREAPASSDDPGQATTGPESQPQWSNPDWVPRAGQVTDDDPAGTRGGGAGQGSEGRTRGGRTASGGRGFSGRGSRGRDSDRDAFDRDSSEGDSSEGDSSGRDASDRDGPDQGSPGRGRSRRGPSGGGFGRRGGLNRGGGFGRPGASRDRDAGPEGSDEVDGSAGKTRRARPPADPTEEAREILLKQLSAGPRTRAQLAKVLVQKEIPDDVAAAVLDRFEEVDLVDDAAFSHQYVENRHTGRGLAKRALAYELRQKGVAEETAREALDTLSSDDELATARELVRKKARSMTKDDPERRLRRLAGMLARKGYSSGVAYQAIREELADLGAQGVFDHPDFD
ncbi:hypothetical protein GCM10022223_10170 [Kineosporia mesophila]|uniref:Regulatory protein RecX n=1 Tax=Kineosporia mesophila TaxID=566012 RepID=A0ABP6Z384_9ACTN|nr:RecX family transcriptional regulator [Kineosporia mesophila]MCD5353938.1 RecX family transcriptional regulator [Kineosporia mesophila]